VLASPRNDPPQPASSIARQITVTASLSIASPPRSGFMIAHVAGKHHIAGVPALSGGNDSGAGFDGSSSL